MTDTPISQVRQTGPVAKIERTYDGRQFAAPVAYVLEDGTELASRISTRLKREVLERIAHLDSKAKAGQLEASFNDAGDFWGTRATYGLISGGFK
jgi:hypothetical protein